MRKLIKAFYLLYYLLKYKNCGIAHFFAKENFPANRIQEVSVFRGKIIINKTGQAFTIQQMAKCKKSLDLFLTLASHEKIKINNESGNELYIEWKGIRIKAYKFENFYVASELFAEGLYNLNYDKELIVCDVGMNVGVASLVFASMDNVRKVYSFEPFKETHESALVNFDLNPGIKAKIVPFNCGVGANDAELEIPLTQVDSATMSTTGFFIEQMEADAGKKVRVQIRDIKNILSEMRQAHGDAQILLKLDCEGAEYEIMDRLESSGLLNKIRFIIIEWHLHGYESLQKALVNNGFSCLVFPRPTELIRDMGMIYACNMLEG